MSNVNEVMKFAQFRAEDGPIPFVRNNPDEPRNQTDPRETAPLPPVFDPDEAILDYDPLTGRIRRANGSESTASRWSVPSTCVPITGRFVMERTAVVKPD